jgi:shikimate dehydrogenase
VTAAPSSANSGRAEAHRWACLLGQPVAHSLSPTLHNAAFEAVGLDAHYEAREVALAALTDAVDALRAADCMGANVTAPHKQAVFSLMDDVSEAARALGAVNTIINRDGRLSGDNTDAAGLARWMTSVGIQPQEKRALVIGAGGAARASVWALALSGAASIRVVNRTPPRAEELATHLGRQLKREVTWGGLESAAIPQEDTFGVVINATSLGHHGQAPDVHPSCYSPLSVAIELAYNPPLTGFMIAAREAGARAENGLGMLIHQAALAFELWTGQSAPLEVYERAVAQRVGT